MSAGRKARGGVSFHVIDGGAGLHRVPLVPREEDQHGNIPLIMVGTVVFGWFAAVGVVWTAYAVCRLTGLVKP